MTGQLYHSGGEPLHAVTIKVRGVGTEELGAVLKWHADLGDQGFGCRADADHQGLTLRVNAEITRAEAHDLVDRLFDARGNRGTEAGWS